ncbi:MAG: prepilin peptidase, partial [Actinomycetota bacterium]
RSAGDHRSVMPAARPPAGDAVRVGVWAASSIHAVAFGLPRWRSLLALTSAGRIIGNEHAICTLTPVSRHRTSMLHWALLGVASLGPTLAVALATDDSLSVAGRVGWIVASLVLSGLAILKVAHRLALARRWRRSDGPALELANVASAQPGEGHARRLLHLVIERSEADGQSLVARVHPDNRRALDLYRSFDFSARDDDFDAADQLCLEHRSKSPPAEVVDSALGIMAVGIASVVLTVGLSPMSAIAATCLALSLGMLAGAAAVDRRNLRLPNSLLLTAFAFSVVALDATNAGWTPVAGGLAAAAPLLAIHLADPKALGFGDVKFGFCAGLLISTIAWPFAIVVPLIAFTIASWRRLFGARSPYPFGPTLFVATCAALAVAAFAHSKGAIAS